MQNFGVSENNILSPEAYDAFKQRSISLKFKMQLLLGIGGSSLFGLFSTLALGTSAINPFFAVGLAALGVTCMYFGAKALFENQILDQDFQAKKIAAATQHQPSIAQEKALQIAVESPAVTVRPVGLPLSGMADAAEHAPLASPNAEIATVALKDALHQGMMLEAPEKSAAISAR